MRVTVFGGGIAGLTAAHELAERGFDVQLVEHAAEVGGLARTQHVRIPLPTAARRDEAARGAPPDDVLPADGGPGAIVPGEHGFRFFPAFYRHLADTMRRTPLGDGRTAHDRLVSVPAQVYVRPGQPPAVLRRDRPRSLEALRQELTDWLAAVGLSARDAGLYLMRLVRFMTSSSPRRARDYEALSWWDYLTLRRLDGSSTDRLRYSESGAAFLRHAPRALVAMDPVHSDARTQGNILVQLLRDAVAAEGPIDAVLDGPTSEAWLAPWRRYLEQLGVRFFHGELTALEHIDGRVVARVAPAAEGALAGYAPVADYYVVALDLVAAERVTRALADTGVPRALQPFVLEHAGRPRDPQTETGLEPWDRLQTMTGVQLYFGHRIELARGYVYYTGSPLALTSIGHSFRWATPPRLDRDGYLALHSVDIGDLPRAAWNQSKSALVREVLREMRDALPGPLPSPLYAHVDDHLEFDGDRLVRNRAPYLINIAGDWERRPGLDPVPGGPAAARAVHWNQVVFAGTYLRTYTRLTSMEAANESARHAVNALLAHASATLAEPREPAGVLPDEVPLATPLGDYCTVWDPEQHELAELDFARALDAELVDRGLPHVFDILGLDDIAGQLADDEHDPVGRLIDHVSEVLDRELALDDDAGIGSGLRKLLALVRDHVERV